MKGDKMEPLTRKQFNFLEMQFEAEKGMGQNCILKRSRHTMKELMDLEYLDNGKITSLGYMALEQYRVKRAVFIVGAVVQSP